MQYVRAACSSLLLFVSPKGEAPIDNTESGTTPTLISGFRGFGVGTSRGSLILRREGPPKKSTAHITPLPTDNHRVSLPSFRRAHTVPLSTPREAHDMLTSILVVFPRPRTTPLRHGPLPA
jgi:hypothetical protein